MKLKVLSAFFWPLILFASPVLTKESENLEIKKKVFYLSKGSFFIDNTFKKVADQKSDDHKNLMSELGIKGATVYYNLTNNNKNPLDWIYKNYLNKGINTNVVLIIRGDKTESTHKLINERYFDDDLINFSNKITTEKKKFTLTISHEGNGSWYPWGMCYGDNSPKTLADSIEHIIDIFSKTGARKYLKIIFNVNRKGCDGLFKNGKDYLPRINKLVDGFSISTYNRCGSSANYKDERSFEDDFKPSYNALLKFTKKEINVAETSTTNFCGNKIKWMRSLFKSLDDYKQLHFVNFFFGDVQKGFASNTKPIRWGFNTDDEKKDFKKLLKNYSSFGSQNPLSNNFSLPWDAQLFVNQPLIEPNSTSINQYTSEPFGSKSFNVLFIYNQKALWPLGKNFKHGPGIKLTSTYSDNANQWWYGYVFPEINYNIQIKPIKTEKIIWSKIRLELYGGSKNTFKNGPVSTDDFEYGIKFYIGAGGDYASY